MPAADLPPRSGFPPSLQRWERGARSTRVPVERDGSAPPPATHRRGARSRRAVEGPPHLRSRSDQGLSSGHAEPVRPLPSARQPGRATEPAPKPPAVSEPELPKLEPRRGGLAEGSPFP